MIRVSLTRRVQQCGQPLSPLEEYDQSQSDKQGTRDRFNGVVSHRLHWKNMIRVSLTRRVQQCGQPLSPLEEYDQSQSDKQGTRDRFNGVVSHCLHWKNMTRVSLAISGLCSFPQVYRGIMLSIESGRLSLGSNPLCCRSEASGSFLLSYIVGIRVEIFDSIFLIFMQ